MRLDAYLFDNNYFTSRTKSGRAIEDGRVSVDGKVILKPSYDIPSGFSGVIKVRNDEFVSLGGYKLDKALNDFNFSVKDLVAADLGASTGGFTQCLLNRGAKRVYAVDLNNELLSDLLKKDERVRTVIKNARLLSRRDFNEDINLVVGDLSFISLTKVIEIMSDITTENGYIIALIKPQFENEERVKYKNGIIKDENVRMKACRKIYDFAIECGLSPQKITTAPIREKKNVEYLILIKNSAGSVIPFDEIFVKE